MTPTGRRRIAGMACMLAVPVPAVAEQALPFPSVDTRAYCEMIMDSNPASHTVPGLLESCIATEQEAADEARARWQAAAPPVQRDCNEIGMLNGHRSYQLILGCIRYREQRV